MCVCVRGWVGHKKRRRGVWLQDKNKKDRRRQCVWQ
jgi:hypothetical protein